MFKIYFWTAFQYAGLAHIIAGIANLNQFYFPYCKCGRAKYGLLYSCAPLTYAVAMLLAAQTSKRNLSGVK